MKHFTALLFLFLTALSANAQVIIDFNPACEFVIDFNPDWKSPLVWLAYNVGRLGFIVDHRSAYPANGTGVLLPDFADERAGRSVALEAYQASMEKKEIEKDQYWEDVGKVAAAGYLSEYVWTYFKRDNWSAKDAPRKLDEFARWQKQSIPNHKPQTYGKIQYKKKS
jgi:hypothetical protein